VKNKGQNINQLLNNKPELLFIIQVFSSNLAIDFNLVNSFNQQIFIDLIKYHRLDSIFYSEVQKQKIELPIKLIEQLKQINKRNKIRMLKMTSELIKIHQLFTDNNIDYISLKGPALSQQLYDDSTIRNSRDLDILVKEKDLDKVNLVLSNIGYFTSVKDSISHQKAHHEIEFYNKEKKIKLEIHVRLFSFKKMFHKDNIILFENYETISLNNVEINVLNKQINIEYLYAHAKNHSWELFYWIVDLIKIDSEKYEKEIMNSFLVNNFNNRREGRLSYFLYIFSLNKSLSYKWSVFTIHFIRFKNWLKR